MGVSMCRSHPPACYPCSVLAVWWHRSTTDSRQIHRWTSSSSFSGSSSSPSSSVRSLFCFCFCLQDHIHAFLFPPQLEGILTGVLGIYFPIGFLSLFLLSSFSFSLPFSLFLHLTPKQSIYTSSLPPSNSDTTSVKSSRYQEFDTLSSLYPLFTLVFQEPPRGRPLLSLLPVVRENVHPLTLFNSLSLFQLLHRSNGQTSLQLPSHSSLLSFFFLLTSYFFLLYSVILASWTETEWNKLKLKPSENSHTKRTRILEERNTACL